jgi:hypothetical protein
LEGLGVDGRIILKWILQVINVRLWTGFIVFGRGFGSPYIDQAVGGEWQLKA